MAIDRGAEVPIGVQLAWAIRMRIAEGRFRASQRLPGLRDMAEATGVNVNTVRAVYQRLEQEGLIDSQQGSGTFVAAAPRRAEAVGAITANAASEARETGVDPREVAAALYVSNGPDADPDARQQPVPGPESGQRRALREQIAAFESALGQIEAANPGIGQRLRGPRQSGGPALLSIAQLEDVRSLLLRRLAAVQIALDEREELAGASDGSADRPSEATATTPAARAGKAIGSAKSTKRKRRPGAGVRPLPASS